MYSTMKHEKETRHNDKRSTCRKYRGELRRRKVRSTARYLFQTKYEYLKTQKRQKMTKNVQCRNGYVNHWEAQTPYIANYEFSSTEHGE